MPIGRPLGCHPWPSTAQAALQPPPDSLGGQWGRGPDWTLEPPTPQERAFREVQLPPWLLSGSLYPARISFYLFFHLYFLCVQYILTSVYITASSPLNRFTFHLLPYSWLLLLTFPSPLQSSPLITVTCLITITCLYVCVEWFRWFILKFKKIFHMWWNCILFVFLWMIFHLA